MMELTGNLFKLYAHTTRVNEISPIDRHVDRRVDRCVSLADE
jgi:hypothetical protein